MSARQDAVDALRQALLDEGIDSGQVEAMLHAVKPNETNIVGNYADLQRMGAIAQTGVLPTPPTEKDVQTSNIEDAFVEVPTATGEEGRSPNAAGDGADADSMTKAEIQAELDARGIDYPSSASKADLQALLG